jgi:predicted nucleotidyltransferase
VESLSEPYRALVARLCEALQLVSVVVFGSLARGEARATSNVDLLVVARGSPKLRFKGAELLEKAEELIEALLEELWSRGLYVVSPIILDVEEARKHRPIYLDMVVDAVIVYNREDFFEKILDDLAEKLRAPSAGENSENSSTEC